MKMSVAELTCGVDDIESYFPTLRALGMLIIINLNAYLTF